MSNRNVRMPANATQLENSVNRVRSRERLVIDGMAEKLSYRDECIAAADRTIAQNTALQNILNPQPRKREPAEIIEIPFKGLSESPIGGDAVAKLKAARGKGI